MRGEFNPKRFSEEDRDKRVELLIDIINRYAKLGFITVVENDAYQEAFDKAISRTMDAPYWHAHVQFIQAILVQHYRSGWKGRVDFIFDEMSDTELNEVRSMWTLMSRAPITPRWIVRRMGNRPIIADDEITLPLQAADLAASAALRCYKDLSSKNLKDSTAASWLLSLKIPLFVDHGDPDRLSKLGSGMKGLESIRQGTYESGKSRSNRLARLLG
jgi:hypothetical protein